MDERHDYQHIITNLRQAYNQQEAEEREMEVPDAQDALPSRNRSGQEGAIE